MTGRKRVYWQDEDRGPIVAWQPIPELEDPELELEDVHSADLLLALEELTEKQRFVVECRFGIRCQSLTQQQVADLMGVTQQAVDALERRALEALRGLLKRA